eukprot:TRINITY_DN30919_c0_g1_i1.p1 TRINITY_DN30919_c0_g1~~TRINITY_DN30919_c0_g1_i1.p1  ORF type:complete len:538 (-),score=80.10 TRINITY_DN30919_c0_g1_i1:46-1659(-)
MPRPKPGQDANILGMNRKLREDLSRLLADHRREATALLDQTIEAMVCICDVCLPDAAPTPCQDSTSRSAEVGDNPVDGCLPEAASDAAAANFNSQDKSGEAAEGLGEEINDRQNEDANLVAAKGDMEQGTKDILRKLSTTLEAQDSSSWCHEMLDYGVAFLIVANAISMLVAFEWKGMQLAVKLGLQGKETWRNAGSVFFVVDHVFCASFMIELGLRLYQTSLKIYCKDSLNILDAILVVLGMLELYVVQPLGASMGNLTILRLLRLSRLVRTFKIVKTIPAFAGMRILAKSMSAMLPSLFWSVLLLFVCMVMGGLTMGILLEDFIADPTNSYEIRYWAFKHYGSTFRTLYTMYEITLAGCWPSYVRPLVDNVSPYYALFFIAYVAIVVFAILRVITAIFLQETLRAAQADADIIMHQRMHKRQAYVSRLKSAFMALDDSGDGLLSREEFHVAMESPEVQGILHSLELEVHESDMLFDILDDGDRQISYEEFIGGILKLKGTARALDMVAMRTQVDKIESYLKMLLPKAGIQTLSKP